MSPTAEAGAEPLRRLAITATTAVAVLMQTLDSTIVNVALPHMQGELSATPDQITWLITSYILATALMTPPCGVLANRFGQKPLFLCGIAGFTAASMLCGFATSLEEMVLCRVLQGASGAVLVPLSQAILLDSYPRAKHGQALAIWSMGATLGPVLGPTLGGWLTEYYSWRWIFYINLPVGLLAFTGAALSMRKGAPGMRRRFDLFGFLLLSCGVASLQLMLDRGETLNWFSSMEIVIELLIAGTAFYLFLVHVFTTREPFVDPLLFRDRNFAVATVLMFVSVMCLFGGMTLTPLFMQNLLGLPVETAGWLLAPRGLGTMIGMWCAGRLIGRLDTRWLVLFGFVLVALTVAEMATFNLEVSQRTLAINGLLQGFGSGFVFLPINTAAFMTLPAQLRNEATSIYSLVRNIGTSIGIAALVTLLAQNSQRHHAELVERVTPFQPALPPLWDWQTPAGAALLNAEISRQASLMAFIDDFWLMAVLPLCVLPVLFFLGRRRGGAAGG
jgi:DHA2 family multidrug resistance protein